MQHFGHGGPETRIILHTLGRLAANLRIAPPPHGWTHRFGRGDPVEPFDLRLIVTMFLPVEDSKLPFLRGDVLMAFAGTVPFCRAAFAVEDKISLL